MFIELGWSANPTIQVNALKRKRVPLKQYIGADFSLLESHTSYIGFEFFSHQALHSPKIAGRTNLAEEPWDLYTMTVVQSADCSRFTIRR